MNPSGVNEKKELKLPFGYRFNPTDVELLEYYLIPKLKGESPPSDYVMDLDVYQHEPRQLPLNQFKHAKQNEGYFFSLDSKENSVEDGQVRTTPNGYWKIHEENVPIYRTDDIIGFKTKLLFHDSNGNKTDWKMIEYRCHPNTIPTNSNNMKSHLVCKVKLVTKTDEERLPEELSN